MTPHPPHHHQYSGAHLWIIAFIGAFYVVPVDAAKPLWYVLLASGTLWCAFEIYKERLWPTRPHPALIILLICACARGLVPDPVGSGAEAIYLKHWSNLGLLCMLYLCMQKLYALVPLRVVLQWIVVFAALGLIINGLAFVMESGDIKSQLLSRVVYLGRMRDPNMYGLSLALALLASFGLFGSARPSMRALLIGVMGLFVAGLLYTQSRGAVIALGVPLLFLIVHRFRPQTHLFGWAMLNLMFISLLVGFEDVIARTLCQWINLPRCTSSTRFEIWVWTYDLVKEHPLLGVGAGFRFDHADSGQVSPHHVLWGTALYFGVPMMLVFLGALYRVTKTVSALHPIMSAFFILGCGFMATNLAQPFAFINWHYVFLWMPLFFYAMPEARLATDPARQTAA